MVDLSTIVVVLTLLRGLLTGLHINIQLLFTSIEEQRCQNALQKSQLVKGLAPNIQMVRNLFST